MQGKTRRAVPRTPRRISFRRDSHAGNARTAFEGPISSPIFWLIDHKPEMYVDLLLLRNSDCNGHDYSFQDNA
jgi:hypothetical protein